MGSVLFLGAWGVLMGPVVYCKPASRTPSFDLTVADNSLVQHLISGPRLPFTAAYFGSIALTLFFSLGVSHVVVYYPTLVFAGIRACFTHPDPGPSRSPPRNPYRLSLFD